jgi:hypothetical protein
LKEGVEVFRIQEAVAGTNAALGSFFVPASPKAKTVVEKAANESGLQVSSIAKRPACIKERSHRRALRCGILMVDRCHQAGYVLSWNNTITRLK